VLAHDEPWNALTRLLYRVLADYTMRLTQNQISFSTQVPA
jgi:hypothetical protein